MQKVTGSSPVHLLFVLAIAWFKPLAVLGYGIALLTTSWYSHRVFQGQDQDRGLRHEDEQPLLSQSSSPVVSVHVDSDIRSTPTVNSNSNEQTVGGRCRCMNSARCRDIVWPPELQCDFPGVVFVRMIGALTGLLVALDVAGDLATGCRVCGPWGCPDDSVFGVFAWIFFGTIVFIVILFTLDVVSGCVSLVDRQTHGRGNPHPPPPPPPAPLHHNSEVPPQKQQQPATEHKHAPSTPPTPTTTAAATTSTTAPIAPVAATATTQQRVPDTQHKAVKVSVPSRTKAVYTFTRPGDDSD